MQVAGKSSVHKLKEKPGLKVFHKGLILVAAPLTIEIVLIASLAFVLSELDKESFRETRYRRCAAMCAKIIALSNDALAALLGYYQSGSSFFTQLYYSDEEQIKLREKKLAEIARGDKLAEEAARQLRDSQNDLRPLLDQVMEPARQGKRALEVADTFKQVTRELSARRDVNMARMSSVSKLQEQIAEESSKRRQYLQTLQQEILSFGLAANLIAAGALLFFYRRSIVQRLQIVIDNTRRLSEGNLLHSPLEGADEIKHLDAAFHKMDEDLRIAAQREKSLFENANDVICVLDNDVKFIKINPACGKLWGYEPEQLLSGHICKLVQSGLADNCLESFSQAMEKEMADIEMDVYKADGQVMATLWSTYYSRKEERLYCIVHDISERKRIEEMKKSFVSMMSSDLRQPLFKIADDVDKLLGDLRTEISANAIQRMSMVQANINRLLRLVNDLLHMVHLADGKLESNKEECKVKATLDDCTQELEAVARKSRVSFSVECLADDWYVDPNRIAQVVVNLASNAVKFSPPGAGITISAENSGDFVEVRVIDKGRGIPAASQNDIFEKFKQVSAADGKRKAGTGLGLPICKDIIEEHGGVIGVISEEGKGSTFWFRVPASETAYRKILADKESQHDLPAQDEKCSVGLVQAGKPTQLLQPPARGSRLKLMQKGVLLLGIPLLFELAFVGSISAILFQTERNNKEELHQRQIAATAYKLLDSYFTASILVVRYHSLENWQNWDKVCSVIIESGEQLARLVKGDPTAESQWSAVDKLHSKMLAQIQTTRNLIAKSDHSSHAIGDAMPQRYEMWAYTVGIMKRLSKLIDEAERKEFVNPQRQKNLRQMQGLLLLLGLSANTIISIVLARFFSKDITSRLAIQADNVSRLAKDLALNSPLAGNDEIARLDESFHATAEKLTEAIRKERAVFDNSRDLACVLDSDTRFLNVNWAGEQLLGYSKDDLRLRKLTDFVDEADKEKLQRLISADLSSGQQQEVKLGRPDDSAAFVILSLTQPDKESNIYCIGHDITYRKELEQLKQDFLAIVSHDLRTPLTSVNLAAGLIEEGAAGTVGEHAKPVLHDIIFQGEQLIELINDLLDLEKLEAGKMHLIKARTPAEQLLDKALSSAETRFPDHVFIYRERKKENLIEGDAERIVQALSYVLCYIASTAGSEYDTVIKTECLNDKYRWQFIVEGSSMTEHERNVLFDRFSADKPEGSHSSHLSALAMPLARSIIESHGGTISIEILSEPCVYTIELPAIMELRRGALPSPCEGHVDESK